MTSPDTNLEPADSFLPTRRSLLSRLRSWDDQDSWREFFDTYWRLIYDVARKSGLADAVAQDVVQETVLSVARKMPDFRYEPARGSFKRWLCQITRCRVADALRQQYRRPGTVAAQDAVELFDLNPNPGNDVGDGQFDRLWDAEWLHHLTATALGRVRSRSNPLHYQVYDFVVVQGISPAEVGRLLGVNLAQVYLIRSRVGRQVRQELKRLDANLR